MAEAPGDGAPEVLDARLGVHHDRLPLAQADRPNRLGQERVLGTQATHPGSCQGAHRQEPDAVGSSPPETVDDVVDVGVEPEHQAPALAWTRAGLLVDVVRIVAEGHELLGLGPGTVSYTHLTLPTI